MGRLAANTGAFVASNTADGLLLAGVALLSYGAWLVYAPGGYIVAGAICFIGGVIASRR